jgi:hypothetical protein
MKPKPKSKPRVDEFEVWLNEQINYASMFGTLRSAWYKNAFKRCLSEYRRNKKARKK